MSDSEYSDSEYSDTLSIDGAVNNLTDDMNTYFVWRDATIQRLDVMAGMIDDLEVRANAMEDDRDALEARIVAIEEQRSGTGGTGGGKRRKKTRKKRRKKKTKKRRRKKKKKTKRRR